MTTDDTSPARSGRIRYELKHNREFRRKVEAARHAREVEAAMDREAAELAEQQRVQREQREAERAERKRGTLATGRDRYNARHSKKGVQIEPRGNEDED